ncbi:hypothetical protein BDF22DRAFT_671964 [Syncephalis plumigaleata]|nr:hypothetical protein BDF22DRAFT_671964 [Syncephalis plumigaleata]
MKLLQNCTFLCLLATSVVYAAYCVPTTNGQGCQTIQRRKEIRDLTTAERDAYFNAITIRQHYNARFAAHGWPWFFTWHRAYLMEFQRVLRTVNPSIVIPYWDWSHDSQAPELAPIWQPDWYGGNGRPGDQCVTNGRFRNYRPYYPQPHCLQRRWDNGDRIGAYYSPQALRALLTSSTPYDTFRQRLEGAPHGQVHVSIGFDMSTMYSPNDPVFFLHHTFIDKLWADWQALSPTNQNDYGGRDSDGTAATLDDILTPFNYRVRDVINTRSLCYVYDPIRTTTTPTTLIPTSSGSVSNSLLSATTDSADSETNSTVTTLASTSDITPPPEDRTELVALRSSKPVPEAWLRSNNQDVRKTRETEAQLLKTTQEFNANSEQVSSAALINREDVVDKLIKEKDVKQFTLTNGNKRAVLDASTNDDASTLVSRFSPSVNDVLENATVSDPSNVTNRLARRFASWRK